MWNHRYFGQAFFGESYFGDGVGAVAPMVVRFVASLGSFVPNQDSAGLAAHARNDAGSYVPIIVSEGEP